MLPSKQIWGLSLQLLGEGKPLGSYSILIFSLTYLFYPCLWGVVPNPALGWAGLSP